jgi:2-keto-3-deoxy-6-phosphogluconate aldolase
MLRERALTAADVALALARAEVPADVVRTDDGRRHGFPPTVVFRWYAAGDAPRDRAPARLAAPVVACGGGIAVAGPLTARTPAEIQALAAKVARALGGGR